eukprot:g36063.t1
MSFHTSHALSIVKEMSIRGKLVLPFAGKELEVLVGGVMERRAVLFPHDCQRRPQHLPTWSEVAAGHEQHQHSLLLKTAVPPNTSSSSTSEEEDLDPLEEAPTSLPPAPLPAQTLTPQSRLYLDLTQEHILMSMSLPHRHNWQRKKCPRQLALGGLTETRHPLRPRQEKTQRRWPLMLSLTHTGRWRGEGRFIGDTQETGWKVGGVHQHHLYHALSG